MNIIQTILSSDIYAIIGLALNIMSLFSFIAVIFLIGHKNKINETPDVIDGGDTANWDNDKKTFEKQNKYKQTWLCKIRECIKKYKI